MAASDTCPFCGFEIPRTASLCPHCARPSRYPNVLDAGDGAEQQALELRYQDALRDADARSCGPVVRRFETEVARSQAVIARSVNQVEQLATSDRHLYPTYYELIRGGIRLPSGAKWDKLRGVADVALFGEQNKDQIRFAALSLDGVGLENYGECSLSACEGLIAHRSSVFEENSVKFMEHHGIEFAKANDLPRGYRATWGDRGRLSTAKLAARIDAATQTDDFASLLLKQGKTSDDDDFVEVHIWGPATIRTFNSVVVRQKKRGPRRAVLKALGERLRPYGVELRVS